MAYCVPAPHQCTCLYLFIEEERELPLSRLLSLFRLPVRGLMLFSAALLVACQGSPLVDAQYQAQGQDSRVRHVVLHYTWETTPDSLRILTQQAVSAHYLITDDEPAQVWQLVDENRRAWHAGESFWNGTTGLNATSIGIEIVNLGARAYGNTIPENRVDWDEFSSSQMQRLIALLQDIVARHKIRPQNIVGHSDIAPQRKIDPGPRFDWEQLAQAGLGRWYNAEHVAAQQARYVAEGLPSIAWAQEQLQHLGYKIEPTGNVDEQTRNVIRAFQMHYRPARYDGVLDIETAAIMQVLSGN